MEHQREIWQDLQDAERRKKWQRGQLAWTDDFPTAAFPRKSQSEPLNVFPGEGLQTPVPNLQHSLKRIPGEKPALADLQTIVFSYASKFRPKEIVVIPRSRGGFSYGQIQRVYE